MGGLEQVKLIERLDATCDPTNPLKVGDWAYLAAEYTPIPGENHLHCKWAPAPGAGRNRPPEGSIPRISKPRRLGSIVDGRRSTLQYFVHWQGLPVAYGECLPLLSNGAVSPRLTSTSLTSSAQALSVFQTLDYNMGEGVGTRGRWRW